jgi:hypothetical protein
MLIDAIYDQERDNFYGVWHCPKCHRSFLGDSEPEQHKSCSGDLTYYFGPNELVVISPLTQEQIDLIKAASTKAS